MYASMGTHHVGLLCLGADCLFAFVFFDGMEREAGWLADAQ